MQKVIIDSDWGGDVLQLASVLLSRPDEYDVLGATVVFGNARLEQNLANAGAVLRFLGVDEKVPVFRGASAPDGCEEAPDGDDAHGCTGLGDVVLEASAVRPANRSAVDFLLDTLIGEEQGSVTLIATGPQTNVAQAIRCAPEIMARLKEIRIMGGCISPMKGYRVDDGLNRMGDGTIERKGNITEWAEFNFQQAPKDAQTVLESGIPIALFPMDCTHQMTFTAEREERLNEALSSVAAKRDLLIGLLKAPETIDRAKFDSAAVMHDVHTTVSMVCPELYDGAKGTVHVETKGAHAGETCFSSDRLGAHWVAGGIRDSGAAFEVLVSALKVMLL